jgi:hypothetical protein
MHDSAADAGSIRQRAYELWERDGRPEGRELEYWLMAESELARGTEPLAGPLTPTESAPADAPLGTSPGADMTAPAVPAEPDDPTRPGGPKGKRPAG